MSIEQAFNHKRFLPLRWSKRSSSCSRSIKKPGSCQLRCQAPYLAWQPTPCISTLSGTSPRETLPSGRRILESLDTAEDCLCKIENNTEDYPNQMRNMSQTQSGDADPDNGRSAKRTPGVCIATFYNTDLNYFGPFYVSVKRSTEKRWGFLFTCLTTRAVRFEVVPSMDTSSCVMGIEGFVSRRGIPSVIWSDHGTNFVATEKELPQNVLKRDHQSIAESIVKKGVNWKFNPPSAPHHGGVWERLVRSFKHTFYAILGDRRLTDEILTTVFCLVEQSLNARSLVPASADATDLDALTPNHFLLGTAGSSLLSHSNCDFDHRKRYARAQAYSDAIWNRWLNEYVPTLNRRSKWSSQSGNWK